MSKWMNAYVGLVADIISEKVDIKEASLENYISTDNMLNNYGGVVKAEKLPNLAKVNSFKKGDILFSNIRTYFKKVWKASFDGTVSADVLVFRPNDCHLIDNGYLYYLLCNPEITEYSVLTSRGAKMPRGDKQALLDFQFSLPPLPEQKAIVSVLSSLDDKIDLLHKQNKTLEAMAETLFRQWFIEEAEDDWGVVELQNYGEIICGKTPSKKILEYFGNEIPFIKIPDMHQQVFILSTSDELSLKGAQSQAKKTLPEGAICISCIATVGLVSLTSKPSQTNQQINSIIPKECYYRYFLYLLMKSSYDILHSMASGGTATLNLNTGDFSRMKVILPPHERIIEFHNLVTPMFRKILKNQTQIQLLAEQRNTIIPKLMSGEVRVELE